MNKLLANVVQGSDPSRSTGSSVLMILLYCLHVCTCTGACEAASKLTHRTLGGHQHVLSAMLVLITRCLLAMMHTILQRIGNKNRKMYAVAAFPFSLVSLSLSLHKYDRDIFTSSKTLVLSAGRWYSVLLVARA